jgi:WbqC-like protein family
VIVSSHQPSFFPWVGYWNKVAHCDRIIMSCAVKFDHGGYQNRAPFNGSWLTVPVEGDARHKLLSEVRFFREGLAKTVKTIRQQLGAKRQPGGAAVNEILDAALTELGASSFLIDLNVACFRAVRDHFGFKTEVVIDDQEPDERLSKCERLLSRVGRLTPSATVYLAGTGFPAYFDPRAWPAGLELRVQSLPEGLYSGTVLQLIARGASLHEVVSACTWKLTDGEEGPGHCAPR